jgi:FkbM family methyltransferase
LNITISGVGRDFLIDGYSLARRLQDQGAVFHDTGESSSVDLELDGIHARIRTWDDLYILNEIHCEGTYRTYGVSPDVVVDIGGNVGHAALYFAKRFPDAHVVAFEPVDVTFQRALENLRLNPSLAPRIVFHNFGLAARDGQMQVEYSPVVPGRVGIFSMPENGRARGATELRQIQLRDAAEQLAAICPPSRAKRVLLKIDCEGAEYQLLARLAGAGLLTGVAGVVAEWHRRVEEQNPRELAETLASHGFACTLLGGLSGDGGMLYAFALAREASTSPLTCGVAAGEAP